MSSVPLIAVTCAITGLLGFQIGALRVEVEKDVIVYPVQPGPAVGRFGGPESTHEDFPLKKAIGQT